MNATAIHAAIAAIKPLCDPRGHGVLDAIERAWVADNEQAEIARRFAMETDRLLDNERWSRKAPELKVVR